MKENMIKFIFATQNYIWVAIAVMLAYKIGKSADNELRAMFLSILLVVLIGGFFLIAIIDTTNIIFIAFMLGLLSLFVSFVEPIVQSKLEKIQKKKKK